MADTNKETENPKDGLALVVGGLFILALVFATYNYFNKGNKTSQVEKIKTENVFEDEDKTTEENKEEAKAQGDLNGQGASTSKTAPTQKVEETKPASPASPTITAGTVAGVQTTWAPNNYKKGDIVGNSYTVKSGDTLWEIAEGFYGNGAEWTKILDANKGSIGFLLNGQQALIRPGQVLVMP